MPGFLAADPPYVTAGSLPRDLGTGVAFLQYVGSDAETAADTLFVRQDPDPDSPMVALFVLERPEPYLWSHVLWTIEPDLIGNQVEYGYEESGIPIDSIDGRQWARAIYAYDAAGTTRTGWIRLAEDGVDHLLWREFLPQRNLFFLHPDSASFHTAPGGSTLAFELREEDDLEPIAVQGDWIQVVIVSPSVCLAEPGEERRDRSAWIRYLKPDGRPNVWFYSRGC